MTQDRLPSPAGPPTCHRPPGRTLPSKPPTQSPPGLGVPTLSDEGPRPSTMGRPGLHRRLADRGPGCTGRQVTRTPGATGAGGTPSCPTRPAAGPGPSPRPPGARGGRAPAHLPPARCHAPGLGTPTATLLKPAGTSPPLPPPRPWASTKPGSWLAATLPAWAHQGLWVCPCTRVTHTEPVIYRTREALGTRRWRGCCDPVSGAGRTWCGGRPDKNRGELLALPGPCRPHESSHRAAGRGKLLRSSCSPTVWPQGHWTWGQVLLSRRCTLRRPNWPPSQPSGRSRLLCLQTLHQMPSEGPRAGDLPGLCWEQTQRPHSVPTPGRLTPHRGRLPRRPLLPAGLGLPRPRAGPARLPRPTPSQHKGSVLP